MNISDSHIITGLIVSAGKSSRMGEFKPLMNYSGKTFLHQIISSLDIICKQIIIVTGFNSEKLKSKTIHALKNQEHKILFNKIKFVENTAYEKGMFTSLQKGLKELRSLNRISRQVNWVLYHFVDQPGLPSKFYSKFIEQIDDIHNWIQPVYKNRNGHPILIKDDLFDYILESGENSNLSELSSNSIVKKKRWECIYKNVLQDIDTKEDYFSITDK